MCRLLGVLSPQEISASPWLVDSERSLLTQSHVTPETSQRDGWGIGWYDAENRIHVQKGIHGAFEATEKPHYLVAAGSARSRLVVGHLRHASNPLNLSREQLLALVNSQPFEDGTSLFAHNGSIPFPTETRKRLGSLERNVQGVNDSEVLYWLLERHFRDIGDPLAAYVQAQRDLVADWERLGRKTEGAFSGLNVLFSTGPEELWAFCSYVGDHGTNLCDDGQPYYEMSFQQSPAALVVGSEPFDGHRERWSSLPNDHYLRARVVEGRLRVETGKIPALQLVRAR